MLFGPLRCERPIGWIGHEVDDVEAHRPDLGQPLLAVGEGGALAGHRALRAVEHLVPGGEARLDAVDEDLQLAVVADRCAAVRPARHRRAHVLAMQQPLRGDVVGAIERRQQRRQQVGVVALGARRRHLDQGPALDQLER